MSSSVTDPSNQQNTAGGVAPVASPSGKGKEKAPVADESMEEEEEEEDEEEDEEMEEDDEEEEDFEEIDPSAIIPTGRRTRGVRVDYTSQEALAKAGLTGNEMDEDDDEETK
ncbi:hypothetical protein EST38_g11778 [Candolleomyces aberdarensis]|uniref:Histone chaperone domain-containing protein n=1 Tax=Candolleomyces aberdarensis TaxID=2316362 RepID=A0A4Q2D6B7_9AGAR|nr:hypothetical protein EST38_g11778 [Candolleomyces aberdarensis]